jgi:hypothetical protein
MTQSSADIEFSADQDFRPIKVTFTGGGPKTFPYVPDTPSMTFDIVFQDPSLPQFCVDMTKKPETHYCDAASLVNLTPKPLNPSSAKIVLIAIQDNLLFAQVTYHVDDPLTKFLLKFVRDISAKMTSSFFRASVSVRDLSAV